MLCNTGAIETTFLYLFCYKIICYAIFYHQLPSIAILLQRQESLCPDEKERGEGIYSFDKADF